MVAGEALRAFSAAYLLTGDPAVRDAGDRMYHALWGKPGYDAPYPTDSTTYLQDIDDPGQPGSYMFWPEDPTTNKWLGFFFGYGFGSGWPAARIGGLRPEQLRQVYVGFNLATIPGASQVRVTILAPSGRERTALCNTAPCRTQVDARQGDHLWKMDYLSAAGSVVAPGEFSRLTVQK